MKFLFLIEPFLSDQELFKIKRLDKHTMNFVTNLNQTRFKRLNFIKCKVFWKVYNYELFHNCRNCVKCKTIIKRYILFQNGVSKRYLQFCKCNRRMVKEKSTMMCNLYTKCGHSSNVRFCPQLRID